MKVLVISDCHGKNLKSVMEKLKSGWIFMTMPLGRKTSEIRQYYLSRRASIDHFHPDMIILHSGHNDITAHPIHNQEPTFLKQFFPHLLDFVELIRGHYPYSTVYLSSIFPRTTGGSLSADQVFQYNKMARRFNELVRAAQVEKVSGVY
jgi:hypothetical protein